MRKRRAACFFRRPLEQSGVIAVLVVLVAKGGVAALIVLGVVIAVQQLEGNVLQPLLMGRAVELNGVAVVLAVAIGSVLAGIAGALLSVPLLAVLNAGVRSFMHDGDVDPDAVDVLDDDGSRPEPETGATTEGGIASAAAVSESDNDPDTDTKREPEPGGSP